MRLFLYSLSLFALLFAPLSLAEKMECFYTDKNGIFQTSSSTSLPAEYRDTADCRKIRKRAPKNNFAPTKKSRSSSGRAATQLVLPTIPSGKKLSVGELSNALKGKKGYVSPTSKVSLSNNLRSVRMNTDLGIANIKWERSSEKYFNGPVDRTIAKAFKAATKLLSRSSFPPKLRQSDFEWSFVVIDKNSKSALKPNTGNCHPGWMTPPAEIFLDAFAISQGCGKIATRSKSVATQQLFDTTVHEMGHAVEFHLLGNAFGLKERWHSEGFAEWFEMQSTTSSNRNQSYRVAKDNYRPNWNPRSFNGSYQDYKKAFMIMETIVNKRGLQRLTDVYKKMSKSGVPMLTAIRDVLGWDAKKLSKLVEEQIKKKAG